MRVLAFDVGTRNMGMCLLDDRRLVRWESWDLAGGKRARDVSMPRMLDAFFLKAEGLCADTVLIEQQLGQPYLGLSWAIYAFFKNRATDVRFVHASVKLKAWAPARGGGAYGDRKNWAVDAAHDALKFQDPVWTLKFAGVTKKDDMADALLYALTI